MSGIADYAPAQMVVVPLPVMQAVCDYLAQRPFAEVAPLALQLGELTTLREYQQARRKPKES